MTSEAAAPLEPGTRREGARAAAPLALAVLGFGVSFGVLARTEDMGVLAPIVMSATTFAGAAQFAAVSVLGSGGSVFAAFGAAALLNSRYIPIGISVAPEMGGSLWRRLLRAQLVVDESWAISHRGGGRFDRRLLVGAGLVLYGGWVGGTSIGVLGAEVVGDPAKLGLDAAFPALFLGLLVGQLRSRMALAASLLGAAIALSLVPVAPAGIPIVAASVACLIGLRGEAMKDVWLLVALTGMSAVAFKSVGPVILGGRPLPARAAAVVELLAPALLAALIATQTFGSGHSLVIDERAAGLGAAAVALALRAPVLAVVVIAAAVTAVLRAVG